MTYMQLAANAALNGAISLSIYGSHASKKRKNSDIFFGLSVKDQSIHKLLQYPHASHLNSSGPTFASAPAGRAANQASLGSLKVTYRNEHYSCGSFEKSYPCSIANDVTLETPEPNGAEHEGVIPEKEMGPMMMDAQTESPLLDAFSDIEWHLDAEIVEDVIPQFTIVNVHDFESEAHTEKKFETALRPATGISSPPEPIQLNIETPPFHLREHLLDDTMLPEVHGLSDSSSKDLNFLDVNDGSLGKHDEFQVGNLSARTRAMAKYFKNNSLAT